jgi:hypothetical protein
VVFLAVMEKGAGQPSVESNEAPIIGEKPIFHRAGHH